MPPIKLITPSAVSAAASVHEWQDKHFTPDKLNLSLSGVVKKLSVKYLSLDF